MADAKKCDRCGCYYDLNKIKLKSGTVDKIKLIDTDRIGHQYPRHCFDICDSCYESFLRFLQKPGLINIWKDVD